MNRARETLTPARAARRRRRSAVVLLTVFGVLLLAVVTRSPVTEAMFHAAAFGVNRVADGLHAVAAMPWEDIGRSWAEGFNAAVRAVWSLFVR